MSTADWVAVFSLVGMVIMLIANMFSTGRSDKGWNASHFVIATLLILSTLLLAMTAKPFRIFQVEVVDKYIGNPLLGQAPKLTKATEVVPMAGLSFNKTTGVTALPSAPVGFQWVLRYASVTSPLPSPQDVNGKLVGNVPSVILPLDSSAIEAQIVSLDLKSVSDFVAVPLAP